ncbi:hypothetical protein A9K75_07870 [Campylobacter fetus subsp. testudinum]|uniref:hypothetical protein n=1 Tax=Campylobacter fetus TaxID=196 RepID=UPI000818C625|nr:hypothetical protein [Campylobacter fetus]OCR99234.1 hypothetical protein A9K75_07870 [Campylobacter fetus subsp. testudinum]
MAKLTEELKEQIIADFHVGKSQNRLAKEYELSPATINKLCKGLEPKYEKKVNIITAIKTELKNESEYQAFAFEQEVNRKLKHSALIYNVQEKAIKRAAEMIDMIDNPQDLSAIIRGIDTASLTLGVNARHAKTEINTNATATNTIKITRKDING